MNGALCLCGIGIKQAQALGVPTPAGSESVTVARHKQAQTPEHALGHMALSGLVTVILVFANVEVPCPGQAGCTMAEGKERTNWAPEAKSKVKRQKGSREGPRLRGGEKKEQREMEWEGAGGPGAGQGSRSPDRRRTRECRRLCPTADD